MLRIQRQRPITNAQRQTLGTHIRSVTTARTRAVCRAHEITGDAYEDVVDQLAQRALALHSAATPTTTSNTTSSTPGDTSREPTGSRRLVVGIAGAPGSGKTTLAAAVAARINQLRGGAAAAAEKQAEPSSLSSSSSSSLSSSSGAAGAVGAAPFAAVVPMDGFHYYRRELDAMPDPREAHARRGAPWTFDAAKFVEAVRRVRLAGAGAGAEGGGGKGGGPGSVAVAVGGDVRLPSFDHGVGDPVEDDIRLAAHTAVVLVEGNYLLLDQEPWRQLRELFDETWFVSCPMDLITQRLYDRQTGIGLAPEAARQRILTNDLPNAQLVAECGAAAAVLVPGWVPPRGSRTGQLGQGQASSGDAAAPAC